MVLARDVADLGRPDFTLTDLRRTGRRLDLARDAWVVPAAEGRLAAYAILLAARRRRRPRAPRGVRTGPRVTAARPGRDARARARDPRAAPVRAEHERARAGAAARGGLLAGAALLPDVHRADGRRARSRRAAAPVPPRPRRGRRPPPHPGGARRGRGLSARRRSSSGGRRGSPGPGGIRRCGWRSTTTTAWSARCSASAGRTARDTSSALAVAPRARGRGHGRTLLLAVFAAFAAAGLRTAELSVHGANVGAARLYESVGMTPVWTAERWEKVLGDG